MLKNRHNDSVFTNTKDLGFTALETTREFTVYCGEYLNKARDGEDGQLFNHRFVLWDILVYRSQYLIGSTVEERLNLLEELFPCARAAAGATGLETFDHLCLTRH